MSTIPRIQHNIAAMNAYRNYSANSKRLTSNLEKLSSGYRINRAGDDAAGLAISEKMRAQISGLTQAKKNANDGINLIQTAEGALTEVHDMLNRMVTLTEQSANGTYDDSVDRNQLQKEVVALKDEINRIADSTNYNGIKLLDGSLDVTGVKASLSTNMDAAKTQATSNTFATKTAFGAGTANAAAGDKLSYTVAWKDEEGTEFSKTVNLTLRNGTALNAERGGNDYNDDFLYFEADDGTIYTPGTDIDLNNTHTVDRGDVEKALVSELKKDENLSASFDVDFADAAAGTYQTADLNKIRFTAKTAGTGGAKITAQQMSQVHANDTTATDVFLTSATVATANTYTSYAGKDTEQKLDLSRVAVLAGAATSTATYTAEILKKAVFEVEGKKFAMVGSGSSAAGLQNLDAALSENGYSDVTIINLRPGTNAGNDNGSVTFAKGAVDSTTVATALARATGEEFGVIDASSVLVTDYTNTDGHGLAADAAPAVAGDIYYKGNNTLSNVETFKDGKLTLQIGDTSDNFNKLSINVKDMHIASMGLDDVDISTQEGAAAAMDKIKAAVNYVSDVRGGLGALQNRLDHTINNLGVMTENIQSAEGAIRDTDVAEEMMAYTKNNILNQAAQAMLAQANQLPQGVLQLIG